MRMLGLNPTDHEVQELVNDLDYDGENSRLKEFDNGLKVLCI